MPDIQVVFSSYEEALATVGSGYDSDDVARVVALKTKASAAILQDLAVSTDPTAVINAMCYVSAVQARGRVCRIVDIGGAAGNHYLRAKEMLGDLPYQWTVVETPAMVRAAAPLFPDDTLRFVSELDEALDGGVDLVICSGTLQCLPEPEAVLERIRAVKPRHVVLARFPVFRGPRVVGLMETMLSQHGPGPMPEGIENRAVQHPITFLPMSMLMPYLADYRIVQRYMSPSADYTIGQTKIPGMTLVFEHTP